MTQSKTVQDTNIPLLQDDEDANPYNKNKPWQDRSPQKQTQSAESMFFPEEKPRKPKARSEEEETSQDEREDKPNHNYEKRWKDSEKKRIQDKHDAEARMKALEDQLRSLTSTPSAPSVEEDDIEKIRTTNPDLFKTIENVASKLVSTNTSELTSQVQDLQKREFELAKQKARAELTAAHPDVDDIVVSDSFEEWAEAQPQKIKDWIYKNPTDSSLAIRAINLYKYDVSASRKDKESKTRNKTLEEDAASLVSTRRTELPDTSGKKVWTRREISRLSMQQYDKYENEIDEAIREGRITD